MDKGKLVKLLLFVILAMAALAALVLIITSKDETHKDAEQSRYDENSVSIENLDKSINDTNDIEEKSSLLALKAQELPEGSDSKKLDSINEAISLNKDII